MCYRFISRVEVNDECALVSYAQPPSTMSPPLCEGGEALCPPPSLIGWLREMKVDIFWGGNTCVVYRRSSWLYIDFFAEDYISVLYVC